MFKDIQRLPKAKHLNYIIPQNSAHRTVEMKGSVCVCGYAVALQIENAQLFLYDKT